MKPDNMKPTHRLPASLNTGFSLIELLVVVAIIGALLSMLVPLTGTGIELAKRTNCASNMSQIGKALLNFAADNEGKFPTTYSPALNSHGFENLPHRSWDDNLSGYDGRDLSETEQDANLLRPSAGYESGIYKCPSDEIERLFGSDPDANPVSYSLSNYAADDNRSQGVTGLDFTEKKTASLHLANVALPSQSILMLELNHPKKILGRFWGSTSNANDQFDSPEFIPHLSLAGSNYLFADAHVEFLSFDDTMKRTDGTTGSPNDVRLTLWDTLGK